MANQPINPMPTPPGLKPPLGAKPIAPPSVPMAPGKMAGPGGPPMLGKQGLKLPPGVKPPPAPGQPDLTDEDDGPRLSFWQEPWVQNVLPFVTSLTVHVGMVLMAFLLYKFASIIIANNKPPKEPPTVAESTIMEDKQPGGVPNQGLNNDPLHQAMQDENPDVKTKDWSQKKGPSAELTEAGGGAGDASAALIAVGPGSDFGSNGKRGGGTGSGSGSGTGEGGPQAAFGPPGGGGIGPKGPVFGAGGNARRIAFVCDASGSMINKMPTLKDQLSKAVVGLRPIQSFEIIFFQDEKFDSFIKYDHKDTLVSATPEAKRSMSKFLEGVTTTGSTDPIPGIEAAFKTKPQLIYLLTDGDFPDNDAVLKKIRELNKEQNPKIKINTIAFVGDGDNEVAFLDLLQTIAKETGGNFRHVKESDL